MAASTVVPVEEYLRISYHPDVEYVDGQLVERHVGESRHSRLQGSAVALLMAREPHGNFHVYPKERVRVSPGPKYRVPDICVMALPYRSEPVFTQPPHLAKVNSYLASRQLSPIPTSTSSGTSSR